MRAVDFSVVGELVMGDGGVGAECRHMNIADIPALPLTGLVLQILDELVLGLPLTPAMPGNEPVRQVLLRPCRVIVHLGFRCFLLQLLDLVGYIAPGLGVKVDREGETTEQGHDSHSGCFSHFVLRASGWIVHLGR